MTLREIASEWSCSVGVLHKRCEEFDITRRTKGGGDRNVARFTHSQNGGYEMWRSVENCYVHQLVAICDGADPHKVFSTDYHVHHINHIPWDNRPENLRLMTADEHLRLHSSREVKAD